MANLRILNVEVVDTANLVITFTDDLVPNLITDNVSIISELNSAPNAAVLAISISKNILNVNCQPLTFMAPYFIQFQSVPLHPFISLHGTSSLLQDGVSNKYFFTGPIDGNNPIQNYLQSFFNGNIYNLEDSNTIVSKYISSLTTNLSRALYDVRQLKNDNYLSFTVVDESQTRGDGPFDRLNEEGAYEIIRVGLAPSSANATNVMVFDDFPFYPITLQRQIGIETETVNSVDIIGQFNVNSLTFNLSNSPVTKVNSIIFTLATITPIYTYDIETLGYQIQDSKYDQDFGFTFVSLASNQIKLNDQILQDPNFAIDKILKIDIQYEYKNLGIIPDINNVSATTVLTSFRETLPPIINVFNLAHAPITDGNGNTSGLGGITFIDPNSNVPGALHPAFINEITFRLNGLPSIPGQYSIDYATGTVYVYGNDLTNNGTGPYPPLATYQYLFTYQSEQDYVLDTSDYDLVALPLGNLLNNPGNINFSYEQVLIPGIDYQASLHQEVLTERIQNNLLALNALKVVNSPITDVFRIYNETSGEIYTLDRWNNDKIYFLYNNPPRIIAATNERASFEVISNELLFVNTTLTNGGALRIFQLLLNNNNIISSTEDGIGFSFNTSLVFSNNNIFVSEKWFNESFTQSQNINRLLNIGEYTVDYSNGIVYVAVSNIQDFDLSTATYKHEIIVPQFPHLISVDDIYYRISILNPKNKNFSYTSFGDGNILPTDLDLMDEQYLNQMPGAPYQLFNNNIGAFVNSIFVPGLTNQIKFMRAIYEYQDLLNSTNPINFAFNSISNGFNATVNTINKQIFTNVDFDGVNYFVIINENIPYLSPNITYTFNVVRLSDNLPLWNNTGTVITGNSVKLILPNINAPMIGDRVQITYSFTINSLSRMIVDYNKGDLFIDYTYLADEIIVSYEYGDNVIDFRTSKTVPANTSYFVSYKVGALRDALLKNFGTLVNIPALSTFDVSFDRERYREALQAALSSFIQGPTVSAIKNIGNIISHIEPQVIESIFENWSLGSSLLNPLPIATTGSFQLLSAKYSNGVLVNDPSQTISFPVSSNLRLEEGTFETWIIPQWNGLDNDATITFNITQNGSPINSGFIFVGASEYHPIIENGTFSLTKLSEIGGKPNLNKDGIFIYYDKDISGNFNRWYMEVIDGYVNPISSTYNIKITTNGGFYDFKCLNVPKPSNLSTFTGTNSVNITITGGSPFDQVLTFIADVDHYLLDFGKDKNISRMSLFKDRSGYFNFRVYDKNKTPYIISTDVSHWSVGEEHHIATSWKLNTRNNRDEMHLFIDGLEVPNITKYGQKFIPYLHEKFRTVDPEEILGLATKDIVASTDLNIVAGSNVVSSAINFSALNIFIGDTIFIDEVGFSSVGYNILNINGQILTLDANMPLTLIDGRFSINRTQYTVLSDIDTSANIAVSTIHYSMDGTDLMGSLGSNMVYSSINFTTDGILPGYLIKINGISSPITFTILQVSGTSLMLDDNLSINLTGVDFWIYSNVENEIPGVRALAPAYSISKDSNFNNILTISNDVKAGDLILIRTLGLNHQGVKKQYYVWSTGAENILMTQLPPPISLDEVNINKIILPNTIIGPLNSTLMSGVFYSVNMVPSQPSISQQGRTLTLTISGNNVDFSAPVVATINGTTISSTVTEVINFNEYGSLDTAYQYLTINYIQVNVKPLNSSKSGVNILVSEKYSITHDEGGNIVPVIKFSYPIGSGYNLQSDGYGIVGDSSNLFSAKDINNYLVIFSPSSVAGFYIIDAVSADRKSLTISSTSNSFNLPLTPFTNGIYQILNTTDYRSGLQNGFFTLETDGYFTQPYFLTQGFYQLEYETYTRIKFDPVNEDLFLGSDFFGNYQINSIMDQVKLYSVMLTDTRIGESIPSNQNSITKDFNSLKALKSDSTTLMLISFDSFPFTNSADFYISPSTDKHHFQSSAVVNENFGNSLVILDDPLTIENDGILDTTKQGSVEFWVSPLFDTGNDPNYRYYFDAYGAIVEETVSINNISLKLSAPAGQILRVVVADGDPRIDYFVGGKIETDTQRAIQEESISINNSIATTAKTILQVITVKIAGDFTGTDYFADGSIGSDQKTIYLGKTLPVNNIPLVITYQPAQNNNDTLNTQVIRLNKKLPFQNTKVRVEYLPKGLQGDRLSIYKDNFGFVNFEIFASGQSYLVRGPTLWSKNTWHRVKTSYKLNGGNNTDELRLWLDGYEYTNLHFGDGGIFGSIPALMGGVMAGDGYAFTTNIIFKDPINELFIGTQYTKQNPIFSLIDNFRISNISRPIYAPYGEPLDVNYNSNISMAFPVTSDLYTTYLLDFNSLVQLNTDFVVLNNKNGNSFDFSVNIFDSFGIVSGSAKVQEILETLIKTLKPANSRVLIEYSK